MCDAVLAMQSNTRMCDHGLVRSDSNAVVSFNAGFWPDVVVDFGVGGPQPHRHPIMTTMSSENPTAFQQPQLVNELSLSAVVDLVNSGCEFGLSFDALICTSRVPCTTKENINTASAMLYASRGTRP